MIVMKLLALITILALPYAHLSANQEVRDRRDRDPRMGSIQTQREDPFQKILQLSSQARERYDTCVEAEAPLDEIDQCMWNEYTRGSTVIPAPSEAYRTEVSQALRAVTGRTTDEDGNVEVKDTSEFSLASAAVENLVRDNDTAYMALQDYLGDRLRAALYGDIQRDLAEEMASGHERDKNLYTEVDQSVFYELFKSQVSKNVIITLSSFCIRGKYDSTTGAFTDLASEADTKVTIEKNIKSLTEASANPQSTTQIAGADRWNNCISQITEICNPDPNQTPPPPPYTNYTRQEACMVMRSMRSARQALLEVDNIQKLLKEHRDGATHIHYGQNSLEDDRIRVTQYNPSSEHANIDRITTFTSGEVHASSNKLTSENQKIISKFEEECFDGTNIVGDYESCAPFLETSPEESRERIAELSLRTGAVGERLKEMAGDENAMREYLEKEGYSKEEIDIMVVNAGGDSEKLLEVINRHYDNQREALLKSITSQINNRSIAEENFDPTDTGTKKVLQRIYNELTQRVDQFTQLVHYNNVVGSFLSVCPAGEVCTPGDGNGRANTAMLHRELQNSYYNPANARGVASTEEGARAFNPGDDYFSGLEDKVSDHMGAHQSGNDGTTSITVNDINKRFLRYVQLGDN